jgi:hypothetical protein
VRAPDGVEDLLAGLEAEVVRVVEAEPAAGGLELLGSEAFSDAWVATGMKMGRLTVPWGRVKIEARARVT